ncbi:hypothetical protein ANO14919_139180 [Xylariales sp. No.14919]|nr:hypothetical protein F5X98DRAFT_19836 [Xylaria grammica]GAW24334.1 hypothetical protein ANO14919_139180 [Xylariales sp. No.14919]
MRGSKPVCLLCRLQVGQTSKTRAVQWRTQTTRLSTSSSTSSRRDAATAGEAVPNDATIPKPTSSQSRPPPYVRKVLSERRPKSNMQISQANVIGEESSRVDALFQQILHEQQSLQDTTTDAPPNGGASTDLGLVRAIGKLREMVDGDTPIVDTYSYFRTEIDPVVRAPGTHVPQAYHEAKFALLKKLVAAKKADITGEDLPTVADIFRIYAEVGELQPKQWTILVSELIQRIVNMDPSDDTQSSTKHEKQIPMREAMLADLVESWKVLSLPPLATSTTGEDQLTNGLWFPRLDTSALSRFSRSGKFSMAFSTLFPQYPRNQLGAPVAVLAITTYALMHDSRRCSIDIRQNATRFMSRVASLVTFVDYRDEALRKDLLSTFPGLEEYVMGLWPKIRAYLKQGRVPQGDGFSELYRLPVSPKDNQGKSVFDAASIGLRLTQLQGTRNFQELDRLWEEFIGYDAISKERAAQIRRNPQLIDSFIKLRALFNQPDKVIVAWNLLGKVGLKPSLRTWNSMLDGLRKAGNVDGIKNIWAKLARSGLKLDQGVWTTRIAGLIDCGDIEGGLHALEEMARLWEKDPNNLTAVAPSIGPVNAALVGLVQRKQNDAAEKLLAWAGRKGVQPDVVTFNTMLRLLIRDGHRNEDVETLLATMRTQGVHANEATFTIILDASFSKDYIRDPEEQASIVADVAAAMSAAGLELNMHTYGKMIYLLLRSDATNAVMGVVNHLYNRNLELSPHISTMLIEHYFKQTPPALDSVRLFVQRRRHLDLDDMNRIFYDRVVKNYSLVGEVQAAMDIYEYVVGGGSSVSLSTLTELLHALLRQDRLKDARNMVNREKKRFEDQRPNSEEHAHYWGNRFWELASMYNLLDSALPSLDVSHKSTSAARYYRP